jgi:hypothetical protein
MNATMEAGRACFGILDVKQHGWLLPADGGQSVYELDTGDNDAVILMVTDCSGSQKPVAPVFTLEKSMTFATLDAPDARGAR